MADELVRVRVTADVRPYTTAMDKAAASTSKVDKAADDMQRSAGKNALKWAAVGGAVTAVGLKAMKSLGQAVEAASNLNESATKMHTIFGKASADIEKFAATSATSLGMSKQAAYDAASMMATFGKAAGLSGQELTKFSTEMVTLSGDLASFFNSSPDEAMGAIGAALRGEAEPMRRYGVLLDDATLKNRAMEMGIISSIKNAMTPQQKALAAQSEILAQTSDAQGDFARTSDGLANSQRKMDAAIQDAKAALGESLLPVMAKGVQAVAGLAEAFAALPSPIRSTVAGLGLAAGAVALLAPAGTAAVKGIKGASDAIKAYQTTTVAATTATDALAVSQGRLTGTAGLAGVAKSAGAVGVALAALVATTMAAKNQLDDLRERGLNKTVDAMKDAAAAGEDLSQAMSMTLAGGETIQGIEDFGQALAGTELRAKQAAPAFEALDTYLSGLSLADAKQQHDELADRVRASGGSVQAMSDLLPKYIAGQRDSAQAAAEQAAAEEEKTKALDEANKAAQTAIDLLFGYIRAQLAASGSADALAGAESRLATANKENGDALTRRTEKGRENRDAMNSEIDTILAHAQAVIDNAKANGDTTEQAYDKGRAAIEKGKDALIDAAEAAGYNRDEVAKYVDKLTKIPKKISTEIATKFTTSGYDALRTKVAMINYPGYGKTTPEDFVVKRAGGGKVYGPGSATSDSVALAASPGEWVVKASSAAKYGDAFMAAVNGGTLSLAAPSRAGGGGNVTGPSYGVYVNQLSVQEATPARVRDNVIDALAEKAYRGGGVR